MASDMGALREEAMWRSLTANDAKTMMRIMGILDVIVTFALAVFLLAGAVPLFPPAVLEYAAIYNAMHLVTGVLAIVASGSRSYELFALVAWLNVPALIGDGWAAVVLLVWFAGCLLGSPLTFVTDCVVSALTRITVVVLAVLLLVCTATVFAKALGMLNYVNLYRKGNAAARSYDSKGAKGR